MAPNTATKVSTPLRVVTQRISNTPTNQLPRVAPVLAATIIECRTTFNTPQNVIQRNDTSENAVLVHKFKTQISALLQDKQPHARYAAVVLIKATVEVGGWNVLQGVSPWVRGLIGVIGVSEVFTGPGFMIFIFDFSKNNFSHAFWYSIV